MKRKISNINCVSSIFQWFVIANETSIVGGSITVVAHQLKRNVGQRIWSSECDQQSKFRDQCQFIGQLVKGKNAGNWKMCKGIHITLCCPRNCTTPRYTWQWHDTNVFVVYFPEIPIDDTEKEEGDQRFQDQSFCSDAFFDHCLSGWLCVHHVSTGGVGSFVFQQDWIQ